MQSAITNFLRKYKFYLIIVIIALFLGVLSININDSNHISSDSIWYHNLAVNIVDGNGYSNNIEPPYELNFFREPGLPFYLAGVYKISSYFTPLKYLDKNSIVRYDYYKIRIGNIEQFSEIIIVRYVNLFLILVSIILFYYSISHLFTFRISAIISLFLASYYPFIVYSNNILREVLLVFFVSLSFYFYSKAYLTNKKIYTYFFSIIVAAMILTFQAMIVYFLIVVYLNIKVSDSLKSFLLLLFTNTLLITLILLPWLITVYNYYPDIKIVKSIGCSLTHEGNKYISSVAKAYRLDVITHEEYSSRKQSWFQLSSKDHFEKSFNGSFKKETVKLNYLIDENTNSLDRVKFLSKKMMLILKNTFVHNNWRPDPGFKKAFKNKDISIILHIYSLMIAILSLLGLILFPKNKLIYFLPYLILLAFAYILASSSRRIIPIFPIFIILTVYFIFWVSSKISKRNNIKFFLKS